MSDTSFCASCINPSDELVEDTIDGVTVKLCPPCLNGDLRSGRWSFGGGTDETRTNAQGTKRHGPGRTVGRSK